MNNLPKTHALLVLTLALCTGVSRAVAQDAQWQPIGPPGGDVISLAVSSQNSIYLGTPDGHIFRSTDAGAHWTLRGRVNTRHDAVIQKLLVDRRDEKQLLAAVWFQDVTAGGALYRSTDAGATWTVAGLSGEILRTIEQSPSAPEIFVAGTRSGVFRSTDATQTWQRISRVDDPELRNVDSLAIDPRDPQTIYAGTYHLPWKTTDAGKTWNPVASGMIDDSDIMSLRVDATTPSRIFASACSGIYRSENAAAAWTKLQGIPYSSRRTQAIVQDPQDPRVLYAATTEGLWVTRDGGESWARTTPRDWVVNDVVVLFANPVVSPSPAPAATAQPNSASALNSASSTSKILLGTEAQGVLVSNDSGVTFAPANQGFSHRITAALLSDPRDPQHLLAWQPGSPDALIESSDAGAAWRPLPGTTAADSAEIAHIYSTDSGWWFANSKGLLFFYESQLAKWMHFRYQPALPSRTTRARSNAPTHGRTNSRATSRANPRTPAPKFEAPTSESQIYDLITLGARVFVATPQALWSGTLEGKILRPEELMPAVQTASALETPAPHDSGDAFATLWVPAGEKIVFSENEGKTWQEDPQPIALDLNPVEFRWLRQSPSSAANTTTSLLAGTTKGLYLRTSVSDSWQPIQNGLPRTEPLAYSFTEKLWLVALRGGGLYASRDGAQSWDRVDLGPIAGQFTGVAVSDGHIVAASLTEGLLRH